MGSKSKTLAILLVLVFLTSLALFPHTTVKAQTKTIVVPDDFPTIQDALANATAGDTVFVKAGNYYIPEHWPCDLKIASGISLIGENPCNTVITASSTTFGAFGWNSGISLGDNASIAGFNVIGTIIMGNSIVTNNIINLTKADSGSVYGLIYGSGNISNNVISSEEQGVGPSVLEGALSIGNIGIKAEDDTIISNNLIEGFGTGIYVGGAPIKIVNNTLTRNNIGVALSVNPSLFEGNNIVNTTGYGLYAMAKITAAYNWWGTTDSQSIQKFITHGLHTDGSAVVAPFLTSPNPNAMPIQNGAISPTSTPAVPEFPALTILPLLLSIFSVALVLRHRKAQVKKV
jgi:hypothetical protein